jgi:hypothetical protein
MSKLTKYLLSILSVISVVTGVVCLVCWQNNIWSWQDWEIYEGMRHECHPVWRDLNAGRIKAGDKVENVIWRTIPPHVERFEDVTMLRYPPAGFTIVSIMAKDGRVISAGAGSCTWSKTFFDEWDQSELDAFWRRYSAHLEEKRRVALVEQVAIECLLPVIVVFP